MLCRKGRQCQQGLGQREVEVEIEEIDQELGSSAPLPPPQQQDHLPSVGPLLPHLLHTPGPTSGEQ